MSLGITQIETLLNIYLPPSTAAERARWVVEDMAAIGFRLELSSERPAGFWEEHGVLPQAEYVLQETQFSIDAENSSDALAGSFLTVGNLLRLAQTVAIARKWIPHLWPYEFQSRLLGIEHLNALNEIWWLKFWRGLVSVERGLKANNAVPDFEWSLSIHDGVANCRVNLEVKRRPGNINNWFKHQRPSAPLRDLAKKFAPAGEDTANVVAMTVYFPLASDVWRRVCDWFERQPNIHGVLIWTEGNRGIEPMLRLFKQERRWAEFLMAAPEPEDLKIAFYPLGTLCSKDEAPAFINDLAEAHMHSNLYLS